jgi:hypothetical protein
MLAMVGPLTHSVYLVIIPRTILAVVLACPVARITFVLYSFYIASRIILALLTCVHAWYHYF